MRKNGTPGSSWMKSWMEICTLFEVATSTPNKLCRYLDVRVKAFLHWTSLRRVFKPLLILRARYHWDLNGDSKTIDFSRGSAAHFLFNYRSGSSEVNIESFGNYTHSGQHARSE
jgi:hypothetical protein